MNANRTLRFVLIYGIPAESADEAVTDISAALAAGALTELPVTRFSIDQVVAAHEAVEAGTAGKVVIEIP
jgi:NADPH2:quinone reductase